MFGHLFPPSFKNWWSDDWISTVYGAAHTFVVPDVQIKHNVGAQKTKGTTRYEVDKVLYVVCWLPLWGDVSLCYDVRLLNYIWKRN